MKKRVLISTAVVLSLIVSGGCADAKEKNLVESKQIAVEEKLSKEEKSNLDQKETVDLSAENKKKDVQEDKNQKISSENQASVVEVKSDNASSGNTASKPSSTSKPVSKPSSSGTTTSKPVKPSEPAKPSEPVKPSKPSHTHSWEEVTKVVHHDEVGHNEQVVVKEAWTEYVPVYETRAWECCNTCGADITANPGEHIKKHMLAGEDKGGCHTEYEIKVVRTDVIEHPAEYKTQWVVDKPAYDETIVVGYKCSCGATK